MANYTDKVIKSLAPTEIETINNWRKEFCHALYDDFDVDPFSDIISTHR